MSVNFVCILKHIFFIEWRINNSIYENNENALNASRKLNKSSKALCSRKTVIKRELSIAHDHLLIVEAKWCCEFTSPAKIKISCSLRHKYSTLKAFQLLAIYFLSYGFVLCKKHIKAHKMNKAVQTLSHYYGVKIHK